MESDRLASIGEVRGVTRRMEFRLRRCRNDLTAHDDGWESSCFANCLVDRQQQDLMTDVSNVEAYRTGRLSRLEILAATIDAQATRG